MKKENSRRPLKQWLLRKLENRIGVLRVLMTVGFSACVVALITVAFIRGDGLRQMAYEQYTKEVEIKAERGTIYDRNMKEMAVTVTVKDCAIMPALIKDTEKLPIEKRKTLISGLAEILGMTEAEIEEHIAKGTGQRVVKSKIDLETENKLRDFISKKELQNFIRLEDNTKRYYPGNELASVVIGYTGYTVDSGDDTIGLTGIEKQYENQLKGVGGRVLTARNGRNEEMPFKYESYVEAENGTNVVLTIDWDIQEALEKHLVTALKDHRAANKVCGIIMDVNTGEVLAMSSKPDINLNTPTDFTELAEEFKDEFFGRYANKDLTELDYFSYLAKNKTVTEPYEPGSTFKIITSAMALEEGVVSETEHFFCNGRVTVADWPIKCHKVVGHGTETFEQGLQNSCNPVFVSLSQRLGREKFYNYFETYGFTEATGIDLPHEASSIYHSREDFSEVSLAVYSFGQTFKVTPIRLITSLCATANGGKIMKPYVVKKLVDDDGKTIESTKPEVVRIVNSENTSKKIMTYLFNGINVGSTKNAYVKGYEIAAKTGTSQIRDYIYDPSIPKDDRTPYYVSSCVSFAPADDPQIAILIAIDEPLEGGYYGGTVAAPVASAVLDEVLPMLNTKTDGSENDGALVSPVPRFSGLSLDEAKSIAETKGFKVRVKGNGMLVKEQLPKENVKIAKNGVVILYTGDTVPQPDVEVPDLSDYEVAEARRLLESLNLNIEISGSHRDGVSGARAIKQSVEEGTFVQPGTVVTVDFQHTDSLD